MLDQLLWAVVGALIGAVLGWGANSWQNTLARRKEFDEEFDSRRLTLRLLWVDRARLDAETLKRQFTSTLDALADLMHRAGKNYALKVSFLNRYYAVSAAFNGWEQDKATLEVFEKELEALLQMAPEGIPSLFATGPRSLELQADSEIRRGID